MNIAISNIAWTKDEDAEIAALLRDLGVKYIEIAPTKQWQDPTQAPAGEVAEYKKFWESHGLEIVAFQSMLFPRPDLKIFESADNRAETLTYLKDFIRLAGDLQAGVLVFGSPKNRQKGDMPDDDALQIAKEFFGTLGDIAQQHNTSFCLEPNAPQYACDFANTAASGIELVKAVDNPGFSLHLDIACMALAGDDIAKSIKDAMAAGILKHFHVSSPFLEAVEEREDVDHAAAAQALKDSGYDGLVSIEMRPGDPGTNAERVRTAAALAQKYYS